MTHTEADRAAAQHAMDEYNAAYEQGGEIDYPQWAADVLKAAAQPTKQAA